MKQLKIFALMLAMSLLLGGCISKALNVGDEKSYCEEHGRDFSDAGQCKRGYDLVSEKMGGGN